ncbi:Membrane domain of glycerophosphoryl diester phosphodiesterase [Haladaptatus litoreus]|uniref:Membrane domain of glycerophosphoryl diester phosphodiesterase n=1 Tax=Haladaptatus litoreus TaxID=553468 RepID=A0A1N6ZGG2_9EURY|nr:glycerophosphoryl diester phosphodiesterase membrane domain-containing protein [Haladaptatus litoreus]SIR25898.1 Membrane domain of glycerophosphoryl diester phosphodiesterase [Haladaptatus litoreus]
MAYAQLTRRGAIGTLSQAFGWLASNPILIVLGFVLGLLSGFGEMFLILSLVGTLFGIFVDGVAHVFAENEAYDERTDFGDAASRVGSKYLTLFVMSIVYSIIVVIGFIFLIIPGIYLALRLSLAFPACVIDDKNLTESLETSWEVAPGNLLKLFGISLLAVIIGFGVGIVGIIGGGDLELTIIGLSVLLTTFLHPAIQLAYARVYLENKPMEEEGDTNETDSMHV